MSVAWCSTGVSATMRNRFSNNPFYRPFIGWCEFSLFERAGVLAEHLSTQLMPLCNRPAYAHPSATLLPSPDRALRLLAFQFIVVRVSVRMNRLAVIERKYDHSAVGKNAITL